MYDSVAITWERGLSSAPVGSGTGERPLLASPEAGCPLGDPTAGGDPAC